MSCEYPFEASIDTEREFYLAIQQQRGDLWAVELRQCLPVLIDLVRQQPCTPVPALASAIRRIVVEHTDVDEGGDAQHHAAQAIDANVEVIVEHLEKFRVAASPGSGLSGYTPPPLMCG